MALTDPQQAQVDQLKKLIGDTSYSDDDLYAYITSAGGSINGAAAQLWLEKTSSTASLIDISEGSSKRNLSDLHDNAVERAIYFKSLADGETGVSVRHTRTRAIVRPS